MKKILALLILTLCLISGLSGLVKADGFEPAEYVNWRYSTIANIEDYPEYVFIAYPTWMGSLYEIIEDNKPFSHFYKFKSPQLYIIKKSDFEQIKEDDFEKLLENKDQKIISTRIVLGSRSSRMQIVWEDEMIDPHKFDDVPTYVQDIYAIKNISGNQVELEKLRTITRYFNGTEVIQDFFDEKELKKYDLDDKMYFPYYIAGGSAIALAGIVGILIKRRHRR